MKSLYQEEQDALLRMKIASDKQQQYTKNVLGFLQVLVSVVLIATTVICIGLFA